MSKEDNIPYAKLKLQEFLTARRGTMYRVLSTALQLLLLGNGAGIGFIVGLFRSGSEPAGMHWLSVAGILAFMLGILSSAITLFFLVGLIIKEVNASETALVQILRDQMALDDAILYVDRSSFRFAACAMITGLLSLIFLFVGAFIGVLLLTLFF